jgi:protein-tyrosine-phosphatase
MSSSTAPVRVLTVCTHNRTRSVMMAALLRSESDRLDVRSAGFGPAGLPAIPDAVDAMRRRGLDVSSHRSAQVDGEALEWADVILTAERDHVVRIAAIEPDAFGRALTLPEFLERLDGVRPWSSDPRARVRELTTGRTAAQYLRDPIGEIADPTGWSPRAFEAAVVELDERCALAAAALVAD